MKNIRDLMPWKKKKEHSDHAVESTFQNQASPFDDFFAPVFGSDWISPKGFFDKKSVFPSLDVKEEKKKIIVEAEIPGVDTKDIDVSIDGRMLTIRGEKKNEKKNKRDGYYYHERSFGSYQRSVTLPADVDETKIDATYKKGVLKIELKKLKETESKKIEVKTLQ